jgi:glycosyltransferase involved in cell wall biosynthesis
MADYRPRLFVDVTVLTRTDAGTGIQRVVRNVLARLLAADFEDFRVEPVFVEPEAGRFRFARTFTAKFLNVDLGLDDEIVDFTERDALLLLDLNPVFLKFVKDEIARLKRMGAEVISVVYDLLPIKYPEFVPDDTEDVHRDWLQIVAGGTTAVCISEAVASDLREYLEKNDPESSLKISHFRLGSELDANSAECPQSQTTRRLRSRPTFLMVGTVEPRKGHLDVLDAFEEIWTETEDVELWVVGKQGWKSEQIVRRLEELAASHPLKWHQSVADVELEELYASADCLIAASIDEGFGLPLVEAANRGLHLVARDIPVFREVCRNGATYFANDLPEVLRTWLRDYRAGIAQGSGAVPQTTWEDSTKALLREIFPSEKLRTRI